METQSKFPPLETKKPPRMMKGKEAAYLFNVTLFGAVLIFVGILSLLMQKPTVSQYERRELAKLPPLTVQSLFQGNYIKDLELYFADTFPFREQFVQGGAWLEQHRGLWLDDARIHTVAPPPPPVALPSEAQESEQEIQEASSKEQAASQPPSAGVGEGERRGSMFIYKGKAMALFGGDKYVSERYANVLNKYAKELGSTVKIYNIVIPSAIEMGLPEKYKDITVPEKPLIDFIYSKLQGITGVDAYSKLWEHKDEYIYFNTDHHWTALGAYYAYLAFAQSAGFTPTPLESMEKRTLPDFYGTSYEQTRDNSLQKDYVDYYFPVTQYETTVYLKNSPYSPVPTDLFAEYARGGNSYSVFLQGDRPLIRIKTNLGNGRKIVVVKESFGNAFAPFLVNNYEEVYIVDQRYFQTSLVELIRNNGIGELLFINNMFAANTDIRIGEINRIMYQQYASPKPTPKPESKPQSSSSQPQSGEESGEESQAEAEASQSSVQEGEELSSVVESSAQTQEE